MHFKNLNAVRFLAASTVVVSHVGQLKNLAGLPNHLGNPGPSLSGPFGLIVFFALSGFLITSLLLEEQRQTQHIQLLSFYRRRALRIWPLYFLIVGLAFFVMPFIPFMRIPGTINPLDQLALNLSLQLLFLPNVQLFTVGVIAYSSQAWSIGIEEQFYLVWPIVVRLAKQAKHLEILLPVLLVASITLKLAYHVLPEAVVATFRLRGISQVITAYLQHFCLLWGAFFGVLHYTGRCRTWLTHRLTQAGAYAMCLALAFPAVQLAIIIPAEVSADLYAGLASLLLYNLVQPTSLVNLEFAWLSCLGKWSYGIYMFHTLVIWPLIQVLGDQDLLLYPLTFAATIGLSWLSYTYFEKPFLQRKERYAVINATP